MVNRFKKVISLVICILILCPVLKVSAAEKQQVEDEIFYLEENSSISTFGFSNDNCLPVDHVRYDKFMKRKEFLSDHSCPNLALGIKYIKGDVENPDGGGKWRYVYCLDVKGDSPSHGINLTFDGWSGREVLYALYYGAVYYGEPCRYEGYATGDWEMDYFVTQTAVHVLNDEFTIEDASRGMDQSNASEQDKKKALEYIEKIVSDAKNPSNYGFVSENGFVDMKDSQFSLVKQGGGGWNYENGSYISEDVVSSRFHSYKGYPFHEQLVDYTISLPEDVSYRQNGNAVYSDFQLTADEEIYSQWQLTGKEIPIEVTAAIPRYWGAGIYRLPGNNTVQPVCLITCLEKSDLTEFTAYEKMTVPLKPRTMEIYKKDAGSGEGLSGAVFSLWGYDGEKYSIKLGTSADQGGGRYTFDDIRYTDSMDGWFLIKEEKGPEGYKDAYVMSSTEEQQEFQRYGGRQIHMDVDGFHSSRVNEPLVFYDEKKEDKTHSVRIIKRIRMDEIVWEHGDPSFFYKVSGKSADGKEHLYHGWIRFKKEDLHQKGEYVYASVSIEDIPSGEYKIQELPLSMRYILTNASAETENVRVCITEKGAVNGFMEVDADVTADLNMGDAEVMFENRKIRYDDYSDNCLVVNHIVTGE